MDLAGITQLITTFGFPIVACLCMGYYVKYITDKNREEIEKINTQHREEMREITQAVNNNTLALTQLTDFISGVKHGDISD